MKTLIPLLLILSLLAACSGPAPVAETPTIDPAELAGATQTAAAESVQATLTAAPTDTPPAVQAVESFEFNGVSFVYAPQAVAEIEGELLPAESWPTLSQLGVAWTPEPLPNTPDIIAIHLTPTGGGDGNLNVYSSQAGDSYLPALQRFEPVINELERLQSAIISSTLPAPFFDPALGPRLEARSHRLDFQNGSGFAALTAVPGADGPTAVSNDNLEYVYHGLTRDSDWYVTFRFPLRANALENAAELTAEQVQQFQNDPQAYAGYLDAAAQQLAGLAPSDFTPDLRALEALVASLRVQPTIPPPPTLEPTAQCTDLARFVSNTLEDNSVFAPGAALEQTWTLENAGTCTWTPGYALIQTGGDDLGYSNTTPVLLDEEVPPGEVTFVTVSFSAPQTEGDYLSEFMLRNLAGQTFGVGVGAETPITIDFTVLEINQNLDLGAPDYIDTFESDRGAWFLGQGEDIGFDIQDGSLVLTANQPTGDRWRVSELPPLGDFYIEIQAITGGSCSGKDSYGLILRAPLAEDNIIDSGYIFGFSCDGEFRFYRMDDGTFNLIQSWTPVSALRQGPNATNNIGIRADADLLEVYVNGEKIAEFTQTKYYFGQYGLMIRAETEAAFQVAIDQMAIWYLP